MGGPRFALRWQTWVREAFPCSACLNRAQVQINRRLRQPKASGLNPVSAGTVPALAGFGINDPHTANTHFEIISNALVIIGDAVFWREDFDNYQRRSGHDTGISVRGRADTDVGNTKTVAFHSDADVRQNLDLPSFSLADKPHQHVPKHLRVLDFTDVPLP